jgi:hypothetical protein
MTALIVMAASVAIGSMTNALDYTDENGHTNDLNTCSLHTGIPCNRDAIPEQCPLGVSILTCKIMNLGFDK